MYSEVVSAWLEIECHPFHYLPLLDVHLDGVCLVEIP